MFEKIKIHLKELKAEYAIGAITTAAMAALAYIAMNATSERYPYGSNYIINDSGREITDEDRAWDAALNAMVGMSPSEVLTALESAKEQ